MIQYKNEVLINLEENLNFPDLNLLENDEEESIIDFNLLNNNIFSQNEELILSSLKIILNFKKEILENIPIEIIHQLILNFNNNNLIDLSSLIIRKLIINKIQINYILNQNIINIILLKLNFFYILYLLSIMSHNKKIIPILLENYILNLLIKKFKNIDLNDKELYYYTILLNGFVYFKFNFEDYYNLIIECFNLLKNFLNHSNKEISRQICFAFRDFIESNEIFLNYFINLNILPIFFQFQDLEINEDSGYAVLKICIIISLNYKEGINYLIKNNILEYLDYMFFSPNEQDRALVLKLLGYLIINYNEIFDIYCELNFIQMTCDLININSSINLINSCLKFLIDLLIVCKNNLKWIEELMNLNVLNILINNIMLIDKNDEEDTIEALMIILYLNQNNLFINKLIKNEEFIDWLNDLRLTSSLKTTSKINLLFEFLFNS